MYLWFYYRNIFIFKFPILLITNLFKKKYHQNNLYDGLLNSHNKFPPKTLKVEKKEEEQMKLFFKR